MESKDQFSHFAAVFQVESIQSSIDYYCNKLGFTLNFTWEDPPSYAVLVRGGVSLHFSIADQKIDNANRISIYVFVYDVDAVYKEVMNNGADIHTPIGDRDYGMRDFDVYAIRTDI